MHSGVDLRAPSGTTLLTTCDGVVISIGKTDTGGNHVIILHGDGYTTKYLHMKDDSTSVQVGDLVRSGEKVGESGNTGRYTTGAHLHFEIRNKQGSAVDPWPYLKKKKYPVGPTGH